MRKKILLVNPPNPPNYISNKEMMGGIGQLYDKTNQVRVPIMDMLYVAAVLRSQGYGITVLDCNADDLTVENLLERIYTLELDYLAIRTSVPTLDWDLEVAQTLKSQIKSKIIFFGPACRYEIKKLSSCPAVDDFVRGDAEVELPMLLADNLNGKEQSWSKEGIKFTPDSFDSLPLPAWDLFPYHKYLLEPELKNLSPQAIILTSRGCPYQCSYCPYPVTQGAKWMARSAESVIRELVYLDKELKTKFVLFRDPEFTLQKKRILDICNGIRQKKLSLRWRCETRADTLDEALLEEMASAGCIGVNIGIESCSSEVLKYSQRKEISQETVKMIVEQCRKVNIKTFCFFIIGLPGETKESVLKTIGFARELKPDKVQFTAATPYPGTKLFEWAQQNNTLSDNKNIYTSYKAVMGNEYLSVKDIDRLVWLARRKIYLDKMQQKLLAKPFSLLSYLKYYAHRILFRMKRLMPGLN